LIAGPAASFTCAPAGAESDREPLATLGTTRIDHRAAPSGLHANEEPVRAGTSDFRSLVGAFHGDSQKWIRRGHVDVMRAARSGCKISLGGAPSGKPSIRSKSRRSVNVDGFAAPSDASRAQGRQLWITPPRRLAEALQWGRFERTSPQ